MARVPGSGRVKGTPNKKTLMLTEIMKKYDLEPIRGLYECLKELEEIVCYEACDKIMAVQTKANIWVDLMSYIYPKRKAIDITYQALEERHIVWDFRYGDEDPNPIATETNPPSIEDTTIQEEI